MKKSQVENALDDIVRRITKTQFEYEFCPGVILYFTGQALAQRDVTHDTKNQFKRCEHEDAAAEKKKE